MKIRAARTVDVFRLVELLEETRVMSRFDGAVKIDPIVARKTLAQMIQRHGGFHEGATCVFVAENREGVIVGFCVGMLDRVYHVGDKLVAQDVFLISTGKKEAPVARALFRAYVGWAAKCPNLFEIIASWTDALPTGKRMEQIYIAHGFQKSGGIFRRTIAQEGAGE